MGWVGYGLLSCGLGIGYCLVGWVGYGLKSCGLVWAQVQYQVRVGFGWRFVGLGWVWVENLRVGYGLGSAFQPIQGSNTHTHTRARAHTHMIV